jgi:hypothetical protein
MINTEITKNITNRIYSIVNKNNIYDRETHFKHGWANNPLDVLKNFYKQKELPESERSFKKGDYVILSYDRDTGAFGYYIWGNDPFYKQRTYTMK